MAAFSNLQEHANFTRLSRLLVDKGTEALRITLDAIHPPANLPAVLNGNKASLRRLKPRVISDLQWTLLFPPSGDPPDSKSFDVTLLTVLLRSICWSTHPPVSGWNTMPPDTDRSPQANVVRIKLFRNEVYAHVTSTRLDGATFEGLWQKISQALVDLNIPKEEIDDFKISALGPEEESYVRKLKKWYLRDEDIKNMLDDLKTNVDCLRTGMQHLIEIATENSEIKHERDESLERANNEEVILQKLAKQNFKSKIERKVKSFHPGTREWLLEDLGKWFTTKDESRLLLLTAGPGYGKSVFAAKVCAIFRENGKLGAYHFCDFNNSNLKDPMIMLQSLASQMCENVAGFKELLLDQLKRRHKVCNLNDAFQIYLQNPLDELEAEPFLIVIDGLDECATDEKSDMVKLIADYFPDLPKCVKVLVTSRPELSLQTLGSITKIEIEMDNIKNQLDLEKYLKDCLLTSLARNAVNQSALFQHSNEDNDFQIFTIARKCEGSFLYAFHVQRELRQRKDLDTMTFEEIVSILPQGLGSVYQTYFQRLENELKAVTKREIDLYKLLEILVSTNKPLPLTFVARSLGLDLDCRDTKRIIGKVNDAISCLLYVYDESVTVFHKSVYDWLRGNGYKIHDYSVKTLDGNHGRKQLWLVCRTIFEEIKENVISGNDLKLTKEVKHALQNGYDYLMTSGLTDSFGWLVDMVIVHLCLTLIPPTAPGLIKALHKVLSGDDIISLQLRQRISWHFAEMSFFEKMWLDLMQPIYVLPYLESVIDYSPEGCFTESEMNIAKALVVKAPRCVKRDSIRPTAMSTLLVKPIPSRVTAVGISSNRHLAAVAGSNGTVYILSLPELVTMWQYSTCYKSVCCCVFAPNDSCVLYGKLETVLCIENRKEINYFKGIKEQFKFCAFSPNGKRLITSDGSNAIKLWDVVRQSLVCVLRSESPLNSCSFSNSGIFVISDNKSAWRDPYCVWNAITLQRVDIRNLQTRDDIRKSAMCNRCSRLEHAVVRSFEGPEISNSFEWYSTMPRSIYNGRDCFFRFDGQLLRVIECIHFTTIAAWEIFNLRFLASPNEKNKIIEITWIAGNIWLVSTSEQLIVFTTGTDDDYSRLSCPTRVLWCSFSPDGTRLVTCNSNGFVNLWNVSTCQIYQRVRSNVDSSSAACCWSNKYLLVFHFTEKIPNVSKYLIDENFEICPTEVETVSLCCLGNEFEEFSRVIDFSQGYLSFETVSSFKILNINIIETPNIAVLTKSEAIANIAVAADASVLLTASSSGLFPVEMGHVILWKIKKARPLEYENFASFDVRVDSLERVFCCFSTNLQLAVAVFEGFHSMPHNIIVVDVDSGDMISNGEQVWSLNRAVSKVFCANMILMLAGRNFIKIFDMHRQEVLAFSIQHCLSDDLLAISRLSPSGKVIAVPNVTGRMDFFRLSIPTVPRKSRI